MSATPQELGHRDELDSPRVDRIEIGTNTLRALVVNGKPLLAITENGNLFMDADRAEGFIYTVTEDRVRVGGGTEIEGVSFDTEPELSIGGNVIEGQELNRLLVKISETSGGPMKLDFSVE